MTRPMSNEGGQVTIAALVLIPLVLVVVGGVMLLVFGLKVEAEASAACRASLFESQSQAAEATQKLMGLNGRVRFLRNAHKAAVAGVVAAVAFPPPALAIARAGQRAIEVAQKVTRLEQQFWLRKGQLVSLTGPWKAVNAVREVTDRYGVDFRYPTVKLGRFRMIAKPETGEDREYHPAENFESTQLMQVRFRGPRTEFSPDIGQSLEDVGQWIGSLELGCSMAIKREKNETEESEEVKWVAILNEDKLLPN